MFVLVACGDDSSNNSGTDSNSASTSDIHFEENDPSSYTFETIVPIKNKTITGFAQKGPFKSGSTVDVFELELDGKTFAQTGKSFTGKVSNDSGAFKISNVSLKSQYALLRVTGYFKSEINGESVHATLTAVTDLSKRENVNVNILTHLEYDRVLYLLGKGMNFTAAKKQAESEVLAAFGIEGKIKNAEELNVFGNSDADAALVAISKLVLAGEKENTNRDEENLSGLLAKIATDIEEDGEWNEKVSLGLWLGNYNVDKLLCLEDRDGNLTDKYIRNYIISRRTVGRFCSSSIEGEIVKIPHLCEFYSPRDYITGVDCSYQFLCRDGSWSLVGDLGLNNISSVSVGRHCTASLYNYSFDNQGNSGFFVCAKGLISKKWLWNYGYKGEYIPPDRSIVSNFEKKVEWCEYILSEEARSFSKGKDGEIRYGNITGEGYKYDEGRGEWYNISELDTLLHVCTINHDGEKAKEKNNDSTVFFCYRGEWIEEVGSVYGLLRDSRDGKKYRTVTIGDQEWMAENLNYNPDYTSEIFGGYYLESSAKDVCPKGWHLPSVDEWDELCTTVGKESWMIKLRSSLHNPCRDNSDSYCEPLGWPSYKTGEDAYGFSVTPVGCFDCPCELGYDACFLSFSGENGSDTKMFSFDFGVLDLPDGAGNGFFPVRCVKD
ncbi:FISUMP domain-containing protein [Fibrobacter succinogenes]|nr:FISUMP domain-containing protein [Fibrobacter succinogenes]